MASRMTDRVESVIEAMHADNQTGYFGQGSGGEHKTRAAQKSIRQMQEMTYERLLEVSTMESKEVLLTLRGANCGFVELVNAAAVGSQVLVAIVKVMASACRSTLHRQNLMAFITDMCNSKLASEHLPKYLNKVQHMDSNGKMAFLQDMTVPLKTFLKVALTSVPTLATEKLELCVTSFQTCLETVFQKLPSSTQDQYGTMISEVEEMKNVVLKPYREAEKKVNQQELANVREPPENFRDVAIVPTTAELHGDVKPFLRGNVVSGRYRDGQHYLDVQFRLLREDFVGPLREGITKYRQIVGAASINGGTSLTKMQDLSIYHHVKFQTQKSTRSGIVAVLKLDIALLGNINWETSKRLLAGSLLCLTHDDFENIGLAVVVQRDVAKLAKGLLSVRIIQGSAILDAAEDYGLELVLAESPTYFEAFGPILRGLQSMKGDKLPFSKYIIDVDINMSPPKYAKPKMLFDLSPLLCGFKNEHEKMVALIEQEWVPILQTDKWPDKEKFGLDASQYGALQGALTRELAIIQGPPGTGKTFLGLKVVQALVHNNNVWQQRVAPILTICFTNHALDQFLEGILEHVGIKGIVRVGGRSNSQKLEPYNLMALIQNEEYLMTTRREAKQTRQEIVEYEYQLNRLKQNVIHENYLRQFMTDDHFCRLASFQRRAHAKSGIQVWLGGAVTLDDLNKVKEQIVHPLENHKLDTKHEEDEDSEDYQPFLDTDLQDMFGRITTDDRLDKVEGIMETDETYDGGWQVPVVQKAFSKIIRRQTMSKDVMTEKAVGCVQDLEDLTPRDRWRLYRFWVFKLKDHCRAKLNSLQIRHATISKKLKAAEKEKTMAFIRNATVVGMTTTGAAKHQAELHQIKPQIVIVEEAAEVFEAHIITALTDDCDHLILIGDHQQLCPSTNLYNLARRYNLDVSLFERMIRNGMPFESLKLQHRMRPEIARLLVPNIYKELLNHPSVEDRPQIRGVAHSMYFVNHTIRESDVSDSTSKVNLFEADYAAALCRHFILQGYDGEKITVLTTYVGQMLQLKNRMQHTLYAGVRITVVDNYQGEENDIIILSLVRSNTESKIGFLKVENRVCVALSRARDGLFAIGNFNFLVENGGHVWNPIVGHLTRARLIGPTLRLVCQNHSDFFVEAKSAADFKKFPQGGCSLPCQSFLPCGHQCCLACHYYDPHHITEKTRCLQKCDTDRPCGHTCPDTCHERCSDICNTIVPVNCPCGHIVHLPCYKKGDMKLVKESCMELCATTLDCGHKCTGTCSKCYQDRFHVCCAQKCGRILVCGHFCRAPCAVACPPCNMQCENRCIHSKCPNKCGIVCKPCQQECPWQCAHYKCTQPCWKECDRPLCQEPCRLTLACGHQCIGMCGEPCPKKCRACDRDEVCRIFFGDEDDEDARFVELEGCGHVFEVNALDHWMKGDKGDGEHEAVLMKGCPKCKTVVGRSFRYGSQVKRTMKDVTNIKELVLVQMRKSHSLAKEIFNKCYETNETVHLDRIVAKIEESLVRSTIYSAEYFLLDNLAKMAYKVGEIHRDAVKHLDYTSRQTILDHLEEIGRWILDMIPLKYGQCGSKQQLEETARQLTRVSLLLELLEIPNNDHLLDNALTMYNDAMSLVASLKPFTQDAENIVVKYINEIREVQGSLYISIEENIDIVEPLDMVCGHWIKCPYGHYYVLTEFSKTEKCKECHEQLV